jgi:PAS domain S-box-containing protein
MERSSGGNPESTNASTDVLRAYAPHPYQSLDPDGEIVAVNDAWLAALGYDRADVEGDDFGEYLTAESTRQFESRFPQFKAAGRVRNVELELRHADGHTVVVSYDGRIESDADGTVRRTHCQFTVLRELERRTQELTRANRILSTLLENLPIGVLVEDSSRRILATNDAFREIFGLETSCAALVGQDCARVAAESSDMFVEREAFVDRIETLLERREPTLNEELRTTDGRTLSRSYVPYSLPDGEANLWLYRDVTDRKEQERERRRENERLDEFASVISHDLRNPLSVAQGRTALLAEDCDSAHLGPVRDALDRMERIIEDTLTLARKGETVAEMEPIDVTDLADESWEMVDTADATLEVVDEFTMLGDRERLHHVFENLFRNAVEYGGEDVTVRVGRANEDVVYVADDGPGVPDDRQDRIFEPGHSSRPGGTGYGLTIVSRIAEAHDWAVDITDSVDGGARFEFAGVTVVS